jgi:L-ascorbate metabolism protein UlaG (beta-lactamase superfamily)
MGIDDAVRLLSELQPGVAVPSHYGMFAENTGDPAEFAAACARAGLRAMVLDPGRPLQFPGARTEVENSKLQGSRKPERR